MEVRDAVERDAAAMAALTDAPESVLRNVVHDRSVRVLADDGSPTRAADADADDPAEEVHGFVSFDARADAVHVTGFGGDREACERLLDEPLAFARAEGLPVELLLREGADSPAQTGGETDDAMRAAAEAVGFDAAGTGPRFRGEPTRRYRYEPDSR